jgi:hypothetical protein
MPNSKINYLAIVKQAAFIAWRNKYLWWFGFFVMLSATGGSFFQYFPKQDQVQKEKILDLFWAHREWAFFAFAAAFLVWLVLLILGIISKGALIKSINKEIENKKSDFKGGFREGKKYFWKIFFLGLIAGIFLLSALVVFIIPIGFLFYNKAYLLGSILSILAIVIFIPIAFLVSFIKIYGYFYAVLSDLSLGESLENAYALVQKNIGPSILIALTFFVISAIVTAAAFLVAIPIIVVFLIIGTLLFVLAKQIGIIITLMFSMVFILALMFTGGSAYQVFTHAILVLFFREIASPQIEEKAEETVKEITPERAADPIIGN